jgi:hypothetical protein
LLRIAAGGRRNFTLNTPVGVFSRASAFSSFTSAADQGWPAFCLYRGFALRGPFRPIGDPGCLQLDVLAMLDSQRDTVDQWRLPHHCSTERRGTRAASASAFYGTRHSADRFRNMREYRFDPPLTLKNGTVVRSLDDAAAIARTYKYARRPVLQESVLRRLEGAGSALQQSHAALSFRAWAELEGLLAGAHADRVHRIQ